MTGRAGTKRVGSGRSREAPVRESPLMHTPKPKRATVRAYLKIKPCLRQI